MVKRISRSGRPRKILQVPGAKLSFTGAGVTAHGGFALVARCFEALQLPALLTRVLARHRTYRPLVATVLQLVTLRLLGGEALSDVAALKGRFFRVVFGWTKIPDATTVGRQLARLTIADRRSLHGWLRRRWAQTLSSRDEVLVSVDPSVRTVYGRQRGAQRGYNPKRRGAKSYFPLVAYDVDRGEVIDAALRPGNWNLRGLRAFLLRLIEAAGETRDRLIVRLDRGCSGDQTFSLLEAESVHYVAKVEAHDRLKVHAAALPAGQWKVLASGAEIASFRYLAKSWAGSRRVVAVRRVEHYERDALFAELAVVYSYDFYVTTLAWKKERVVAAYHRGALVETGIKELFEDLAALATTTSSWRVNAALLLVGVLAQRVLSHLRRTALPPGFRTARIKRIRFAFLDIGARIASHARCLQVRLDRHYPWRHSWYSAWQTLTPPAPT